MVPPGFQLFQLVFQLIALLVAVAALGMAAFPRQMTQWKMRGPEGTTQIEPGQMRLLLMRVMGVFVAVIALLMAFGSRMILP